MIEACNPMQLRYSVQVGSIGFLVLLASRNTNLTVVFRTLTICVPVTIFFLALIMLDGVLPGELAWQNFSKQSI